MKAKQVAFLNALLTSKDTKEAISRAGIHRDTAYRYLADPEFKQALKEAQKGVVNDTVNYMRSCLSECVERLMSIVRSEKISPAIQVQAINCLFSNYRPLSEDLDILERIQALEAAIKKDSEQ